MIFEKTLSFLINFNTNKSNKFLTQKINIISWEKKINQLDQIKRFLPHYIIFIILTDIIVLASM